MSVAGRHRRGGATRAEVKASGQGNPPTGGSVSTGHQLIMANSAHISSAVPQLLSCLKTYAAARASRWAAPVASGGASEGAKGLLR